VPLIPRVVRITLPVAVTLNGSVVSDPVDDGPEVALPIGYDRAVEFEAETGASDEEPSYKDVVETVTPPIPVGKIVRVELARV